MATTYERLDALRQEWTTAGVARDAEIGAVLFGILRNLLDLCQGFTDEGEWDEICSLISPREVRQIIRDGITLANRGRGTGSGIDHITDEEC